MARLARVVIPGLPHHVTQRGNNREAVFFCDDDDRAYLDLISGAARASGTEVWAYCLMPNHVHFIMTPATSMGCAPPSQRRTAATAPASMPG
jgi:putative transposase